MGKGAVGGGGAEAEAEREEVGEGPFISWRRREEASSFLLAAVVRGRKAGEDVVVPVKFGEEGAAAEEECAGWESESVLPWLLLLVLLGSPICCNKLSNEVDCFIAVCSISTGGRSMTPRAELDFDSVQVVSGVLLCPSG